MKRLNTILLIFIATFSIGQRTLEWSIGDVQVTCNGEMPTELCYSVMVSINDANNTPQLASSTMRFYYDAYYLSNFTPSNLENNYTASSPILSNPVLGNEFDFTTDEGVWARFEINASNTPINLSTTPVHVLDFCFQITSEGAAIFNSDGFLCAPIVFDNNHSQLTDYSYLTVNNEGINGNYYLNGDNNTAIKADDEVINYLWTEDLSYSGFISPSQSDVPTGITDATGCIENICLPEVGILEWSIDTVYITCTDNVPSQLCYRLMVSTTANVNDNPQLATSSMRFFYDSHLLSYLNIPVDSIENGYSINIPAVDDGFNDPPDTGPYGDIFGFSSSAGNWVQFEIVANNGNPLNLSATPTHVLNLCFTPNNDVIYPLCAPIVFDNNHIGWDTGINGDDGYLQSDEGITGNYYINGNTGNPILADDEVINYLWIEDPAFDGLVDNINDRTGSTDDFGCIENICDIVFPVDWLYFTGRYSDNEVILEWSTASEINNKGFEIQYSTNRIDFTRIAFVEGKGNASFSIDYKYIHENPQAKHNYYRLVQKDFNGQETYSDIVLVRMEDHAATEFFPNPVNSDLRIITPYEDFNVIIKSLNGKVVTQEVNKYTLDISNLDAGIFLIEMWSDSRLILFDKLIKI